MAREPKVKGKPKGEPRVPHIRVPDPTTGWGLPKEPLTPRKLMETFLGRKADLDAPLQIVLFVRHKGGSQPHPCENLR
jgi:hypothetical protein